uniref:Uncharacterized protein n=1 Tax=Globisporangium ultimum (strain ATCC 200006 / CBS 805.95 / DAOM BR144) TaxID=431595 RepID=K3W7N7_GLOUD
MRRPREVPVNKPSAVQTYVPQVLLRQDDQSSSARRRWLPTERRPVAKGKASVGHVAYLESEMEKFVQEFYVAAATFSTQASAQQAYDVLARVASENAT